jgi:uncharacterized protein
MVLKGSTTINASKEKVWAFLTEAEGVSQCAPGVETFEVLEPNKSFRVLAGIGFGTVKVKFNTDVEWLELDPPHRGKMKAHGKAPGSAADVITEMALSDAPSGGTQLDWSANVAINGTIASLATRLMGSVAQKLAGAFFECAKGKIEN